MASNSLPKLITIWITFTLLHLAPTKSILVAEQCKFPAIFNFGDSNSDTGGLSAVFGQAPPPHGISFFGGPAGRYCDGRLLIDFIAEGLGLPYISGYLDSVGSDFTHGANFATAGSTVRPQNTTLQQSGFSPISLDVQWNEYYEFVQRSQAARNHSGVFRKLLPHNGNLHKKLLPKAEAFSKALYTFDIGQNDLTAGYFANMTVDEVIDNVPDIVTKLSDVIRYIYGLGGRHFWIHNTGPVGCLPYVLEKMPVLASQVDEVGCATPFNDVARIYNSQLKDAVVKLRKVLPLASITYVDIYKLKCKLFHEGKKHGFKQAIKNCCGYGGKYNFNLKQGCGAKKTVKAFIFNVLTITLASSNSSAPTTSPQNKTCHFPAIFNFGDSNSDTGGLAALFGQFPPPHGVPFFGSPTGRYCDGRLVIDFLAEGLGYPFLSPYLDSIGSNFRHGVNFATAGATAIPRNIITHRQSPISLDYQWNQFSDFHNKSQIVRDRGGFYRKLFPKATDFSTALYTIDIGQNDLTNSSLLNQTEPQVTSFLQDVVNQTHNLIRNIYSLGGRNFIVHSVGPLGCLAYVIEGTPDLNSSGIDNIGCSIPYNQVAQTYNNHLRQAIVQLRKDLPLAAITYVDMYSIKYSLFREPRRHGFKQWLRACCGRGGKYNYDIHMGCGAIKFVNGKEISVRKICNHPGEYVIWDGVHFTEASNKFIYKRFVKGEFSDPAVPLRRSCHT